MGLGAGEGEVCLGAADGGVGLYAVGVAVVGVGEVGGARGCVCGLAEGSATCGGTTPTVLVVVVAVCGC